MKQLLKAIADSCPEMQCLELKECDYRGAGLASSCDIEYLCHKMPRLTDFTLKFFSSERLVSRQVVKKIVAQNNYLKNLYFGSHCYIKDGKALDHLIHLML